MLRRLFGPKSRKVAGDGMKLCDFELYTLFIVYLMNASKSDHIVLKDFMISQ